MKKMKFNILEIHIMGIIHPGIFCRGWVDSTVKKITIQYNNSIFFEQLITPFNEYISYFTIIAPLPSHRGAQLIAVTDENSREVILEIKTNILQRCFNKLYKIQRSLPTELPLDCSFDIFNKSAYLKWIDRKEVSPQTEKYQYNPLISLIIPVYNVEPEFLCKCLDSVLAQTYTNFEICLADDCSTNENTLNILKKYQQFDERIKVVYRKENGHISKASNTALELANGEFVGLVDNDDELVDFALNEVVRVLNMHYDIDLIYTDEDKIGLDGQRECPHFKSDFAPESFYSGNYVCHFSVIRKTIIDKVGGFRDGYVGAQDFDLFLRVYKETKKIYHIPRVLYHWRMLSSSTSISSSNKSYAADAGKRALEDYFHSLSMDVTVDICLDTNYFVQFPIPELHSLELIIYFTGSLENMNDCIDFHLKNATKQISAITIINTLSSNFNFEVPLNIKMNILSIKDAENAISYINQHLCKSPFDYYAFICDDTRIQTPNWIEMFIGYASQTTIGMVAGKIYNLKNQVSESGIVLTTTGKLLPANKLFDENNNVMCRRLAVPHNYSILNNKCFIIENTKFKEVGGFDAKFDYFSAPWDLALKLCNHQLRNVLVPHVVSLCAQSENNVHIDLHLQQLLYSKWGKFFDHDPYYNENLSEECPFELNR